MQYAVVTIFSHKTAPHVEAERVLHERIVPGVRQSPGFIAGYWTYDADTKKSHNMLIFESEEAAKGMMASVQGNSQAQALGGLHLDLITVTQVNAEAHR